MSMRASRRPLKGSSERAATGAARSTGSSFNPTRVRLKVTPLTSHHLRRGLQPHKGSSESQETDPNDRARTASTPQGFV